MKARAWEADVNSNVQDKNWFVNLISSSIFPNFRSKEQQRENEKKIANSQWKDANQ